MEPRVESEPEAVQPGRSAGRTVALVVGLVFVTAGLVLGVTLVMLPAGVVLGVAGILLAAGSLALPSVKGPRAKG